MSLHRPALYAFCLCAVGLLATSHAVSEPHTGRALWHIFDARDIGAAGLTRGVSIDSRGIFYGANESGLVTFDGINWDITYAGTARSSLHTILALGDGRWLAGGPKTLGTFTPTPQGTLQWTEDTEAGLEDNVLNLVRHDGDVYVITDRAILIRDTEGLRTLFEGSPTGFAFTLGSDFLVAAGGKILNVSREGSKTVELSPEWDALSPVAALTSAQHALIIVTRRSGLYGISVKSNSLAIEPIWPVLPVALEAEIITAALRHQDGSYVFGTASGALLQLDSEGKVIRALDRQNGFYTGPIHALASRPDGNLIAFYDGGAVWLDLSDQIRTWDSVNGLPGTVTAVSSDTAAVYAGTNLGLFRSLSGHRMRQVLEAGDIPVKTLNVFRRSDMPGHTSLLVGRNDGLFDLFDRQFQPIVSAMPRVVHISRMQPSRVAVGISNAIEILEFDQGEWIELGALGPETLSAVSDIAESTEGDLLVVLEDGTLKRFVADTWLGTGQLADASPVDTQTFPNRPLPGLRPFFTSGDDTTHLFLNGSALVWNSRSERFESDTRLTTQLAGFYGDEVPLWYAATRTDDTLWLQAHRNSFKLSYMDMQITQLPRATNGTESSKSIFLSPTFKQAYFATPDGLFSLPMISPDSDSLSGYLPHLVLRRVAADKDVLYDGEGTTPALAISEGNQTLMLHFAVLEWHTRCEGGELHLEVLERGSVVATRPLTSKCSVTFSNSDINRLNGTHSFRLTLDGKPVTTPIDLTIETFTPWYARSFIAFGLAFVFAGLSVFGGRNERSVWPEPLRRYLAVASGLSICLALAIAFSAIQLFNGAMIFWLGALLVTSIVLPIFSGNIMRFGDRQPWSAN